MKKFELTPVVTNRKSFYKKAFVIEIAPDVYQLLSYETIVCEVDHGVFKRYWDDYSATTMSHVNDFIALFDIQGGGKKWWMEQPVNKYSDHLTERIQAYNNNVA